MIEWGSRSFMTQARRVASAAIILLFASGAHAQDAAAPSAGPAASPAARCTGVLCELYYANKPVGQPDPTALPCHDFVCGMFGGRTPDAPVAQPVSAPVPAAAPAEPPRKAKRAARRRTKPHRQSAAKAGPAAPPAGAPEAAAPH
jgi:hypothetical protein